MFHVTILIAAFTLADDPIMPPDKAAELFARIDTDGSNSLSLEEFVAGHKEEKAELATKRFAKMDRDADGAVSPDEFKAGLAARKEKRKNKKQ